MQMNLETLQIWYNAYWEGRYLDFICMFADVWNTWWQDSRAVKTERSNGNGKGKGKAERKDLNSS
jgi:hypothetical protein